MRALPRSEALRQAAWPRVQDGLFAGLTVLIWLAGNLLAALGVVTAVFFLLSGASLHPFLLQLHNMTVRYVAADGVRQAAFVDLTATAVAVLLLGVCLMRLSVLRGRLRAGQRERRGGEA